MRSARQICRKMENMETQLSTVTLAQIVSSNHKAASVFEKYHLDFCCKGKRSLEQACREQNIELNEIEGELRNILLTATADTIDLDTITLTMLCDYIVLTHHAYVKKEMPLITGYLQKVSSKHGDRHPELNKIFQIFTALKEEMEGHMKKEELILFPRIKELEKFVNSGNGQLQINIGYLQSPINVMEHEHDHAGTLLNEIRSLTGNYTPPQDACTTYRLSFAALQAFELDLHQHVHLENNILFPKAIEEFERAKVTANN